MEQFLETRSGLLAASAIVLICPLKWEREHEIDYHNGDEPHSTVATREAVEEFIAGQI
jgi:hypothetical protein